MSDLNDDGHGTVRSEAGAGASTSRADCPCRKKRCPNFGSCGPCRAKHGAKGGNAYCER
jgi:hypothetical protein